MKESTLSKITASVRRAAIIKLTHYPSVPPAVLADLGFEAGRHPRRGAFGGRVAVRARCAGGAARAGVGTFPRPSRMVFAVPSQGW